MLTTLLTVAIATVRHVREVWYSFPANTFVANVPRLAVILVATTDDASLKRCSRSLFVEGSGLPLVCCSQLPNNLNRVEMEKDLKARGSREGDRRSEPHRDERRRRRHGREGDGKSRRGDRDVDDPVALDEPDRSVARGRRHEGDSEHRGDSKRRKEDDSSSHDSETTDHSSSSSSSRHRRRRDSKRKKRKDDSKRSKKERKRRHHDDDSSSQERKRRRSKSSSRSDRKKDRKKRKGSKSTSENHEDTTTQRRSVITGKKIKMHIEKNEEDHAQEQERQHLLAFMNSSF
jgi:hypothetical protein